MKKGTITRLAGSAGLAALVLGTGFLGVRDSAAVGALSEVKITGSGTVIAMVRAMETPFETFWNTGGTATNAQEADVIGSSKGIRDQLCNRNDVGMSSRALTSAETDDCGGAVLPNPHNPNNELNVWKVARDATVWVTSSASPACLTQVTDVQLKDLYTSGAAVGTKTFGNTFATQCAGDTTQAVPRARVQTSGSYIDAMVEIGISCSTTTVPQECATELPTITATGLPRNDESLQQADSAACNIGHISYTSLANLTWVCTSDASRTVRVLAASDAGSPFVTPSKTTVINGTYPFLRTLNLITRRHSNCTPSPCLFPAEARALDYINFVYANPAITEGTGFVALPSPTTTVPVPDQDVNLSGVINLSDVGSMFPVWGTSDPLRGWIRQDVNNSGTVNLSDVGSLFPVWGSAGFQHPAFP